VRVKEWVLNQESGIRFIALSEKILHDMLLLSNVMPVFADHLAEVYSEVPGGLTKTDINNPPPLHATVESHLPTYDSCRYIALYPSNLKRVLWDLASNLIPKQC